MKSSALAGLLKAGAAAHAVRSRLPRRSRSAARTTLSLSALAATLAPVVSEVGAALKDDQVQSALRTAARQATVVLTAPAENAPSKGHPVLRRGRKLFFLVAAGVAGYKYCKSEKELRNQAAVRTAAARTAAADLRTRAATQASRLRPTAPGNGYHEGTGHPVGTHAGS